MNKNYYAVIMAGGVGSRFWPVSKKSFPKQFHDILGSGKTLIQQTFSRLEQLIPKENIFILTNEIYQDLVQQQLPGIQPEQIVLEPSMNNTAPCILLSALKIHKKNKNALMVVAPSDHWIEDEKTFLKELQQAYAACDREKNLLMTLGVKPTFPNTGYGYIQFKKTSATPIKEVLNFTEKPDYKQAKSFLEQGNYLWNAGIFIWSTQSILNEFEQHLPEMYSLLSGGEKVLNTPEEQAFVNENYPKTQNISIDYGIMEKAAHVCVLPAEFDWNDLGSWGALYDELEKDSDDNVVVNAQTYLENSKHNIIHTSKGKTVVLKDLSDFIVVEDEQILMIYPKNDEQGIKQLRENVKNKLGDDLV